MEEQPLQKDTIFEVREEFMVPTTGGIPTRRRAHFLKPISESISGPNLKLPSLSPSSKWPIEVAFNGWRDPQRKWVSWVVHMYSLYHPIWKKAGILEAIMASTFKISKNPELILGLGERWCPETNTFIFPFGEATITLEDMMVLGGFSVLGSPVTLPLETTELLEIEEKLENLRKELEMSPERKASHLSWLKHYMQSGIEEEHEAFLSLWLSRFVFPQYLHDTINKSVFPIAIHLARGTRIALAPAVLASLYRDLGLLKETIVAARELDCDGIEEESYLALTVWAPFLFVQVWGWERIPEIRPKAGFLNPGNLRLARWHGVRRTNIEDIQSLIESAGESFLWRPYAMVLNKWEFPKFYKEEETWLSYNNLELDEEFQSYFHCLRACELYGLDCTEPYFPNRVAMQFGMDQDLPGWFPRSMTSRETDYSRPIHDDTKLYLPCRLFEGDVTSRYSKWWRTVVSDPRDGIEVVYTRHRSVRRSKRLELIARGTDDGDNAEGCSPTHSDDGTTDHEGQAEHRGVLSSTEANEDVKETKSSESPVEESVEGMDATGKSDMPINCCINAENESETDDKMVLTGDIGSEGDSSIVEEFDILNLDARISKLEREVAAIKKARFGGG